MSSSSWNLVEAFAIGESALVSIVGGGGKTSLLFGLANELPGRVVVTTTTRIFAAQMKLATAVLYENDLAQLDTILTKHDHCLIVGETQGDKAHGVSAELPSQLLTRGDVDYVLVEADGSRMLPIKAPKAHEPVVSPATTHLVPVVGIDALAKPLAEVAHRPQLVSELTAVSPTDYLTPQAIARLLAHPNGGSKQAPPAATIIPLINKVETAAQLAQARQIAAATLQYPTIDRVVIGAMRQPQPVVEVRQRITAVILAAGLGSRMGQATKQLLPWGETTVLGQTICNVQQTAVTDMVVISGHEADKIEAVTAEARVRTVYNPDYATGEMLSSLKTAVRHLPDNCDAILVMLADQPMVLPETLNQLLDAFAQTPADLMAPTYQGKRGNPVLIGRHYFAELLALSPDEAPRTLLQRHADKLQLVPVASDSILRDLDRVEDYERERPFV
ncbi:MAG: selenium cofactor biosynthesis protein YqeC [Chloroflexota bacterium]